MTWWQAVVLGLVEGITEYLPVSSTGHLILAEWVLALDDPARKAAVDAFSIVVQGGAILAVAGLYRHRVLQIVAGVFGRDPVGRRLARNLLVAFVPAAVAGFLLDDVVERALFHVGPVLLALALGGVFMIWLSRRPPRAGGPTTLDALTAGQALQIGLLQCLALWPGTSRSMTTIAGGTLCGLPPAQAAEFSFLLGLPTLGAACGYTLAKDVGRSVLDGTPSLFATLGGVQVALGASVATISAAVAVRWLVGFLSRRGLAPFGWYRIGLALVLLVLAASGLVDVRP